MEEIAPIVVDGSEICDWLRANLSDDRGTVGNVVPPFYPAYCRILHPVHGRDGTTLRWDEIPVPMGRVVHPLVQWESLVGSASTSLLDLFPPRRGRLPPDAFTELCAILMDEHRQVEWLFAFWLGWAWSAPLRGADDQDHEAHTGAAAETVHLGSSVLSTNDLRRPVCDLGGGREYRVMRAAAETGYSFGDPRGPWGGLSTPNMLWPDDRSWFVGTEIDFDSTIVGGPEPLVERLLSCRMLETWRVEDDSVLRQDGDVVNPRPE